MIRQIIERKDDEGNETSLLDQLAEMLIVNRKVIVDAIADRLKQEIPEASNVPPDSAIGSGCANSRIQLTAREETVLERIVQGKINKEICADIYLSEGSVKKIITKLLEKFGLEDRTQLAVSAVVNNMVADEALAMYKK